MGEGGDAAVGWTRQLEQETAIEPLWEVLFQLAAHPVPQVNIGSAGCQQLECHSCRCPALTFIIQRSCIGWRQALHAAATCHAAACNPWPVQQCSLVLESAHVSHCAAAVCNQLRQEILPASAVLLLIRVDGKLPNSPQSMPWSPAAASSPRVTLGAGHSSSDLWRLPG